MTTSQEDNLTGRLPHKKTTAQEDSLTRKHTHKIQPVTVKRTELGPTQTQLVTILLSPVLEAIL